MSRFQRHIFVCINERPENHPKGCCFAKGASEIRDLLKVELGKHGLSGVVRANNAGCLDACSYGPSMVIYPDGIWYGRVTKDDIQEIVERTVMNGEVIQRLLIPEARFAPAALQFPGLPMLGDAE